jgi:hypothetical protein
VSTTEELVMGEITSLGALREEICSSGHKSVLVGERVIPVQPGLPFIDK